MKILVMSDSHAELSFMRRWIQAIKPDAMIHLGDHFSDGESIAEENPEIPMHQVPGNCDRYRCPPGQPEILIQPVCGVLLYMTHGHKHSVKSYLGALLRDARASKAAAVLYGHTHIGDCHREADGLWVLNPGSCGYGGGSAGIIETDGENITACYLMDYRDLDAAL